MKKNFLVFIVLLLSLNSFAQGENNNWYFGNRAGLDFNSGSPVALNDSAMRALNGSSSISTAAGQLLMYTDGITVWNKNHQVMPNGTRLLGDLTRSQETVIVQKPSSDNFYYIFSTTGANLQSGVYYSEVDMNLDGGMGAVNADKNILLSNATSRSFTVVKNASRDGYWFITSGINNTGFLAYRITSSGVNPAPVISTVGFTSGPNRSENSYLKSSPEGTKLLGNNALEGIYLFDFDASTGVVSNRKLVASGLSRGAEFSPSGKFANIPFSSTLEQYDLTASTISSTAIIVAGFSTTPRCLQIASNGKIYALSENLSFLSIINNPDVLGLNCNYQVNRVSLGLGTGVFSLPPFVQSYPTFEINVQNSCLGDATAFSLSSGQIITGASWNFGDGTTSTAINPTHTYANPGNYSVTVTATGTNGTRTKTRAIVIDNTPTATQPQNLAICDPNNDGLYNFDLTTQTRPSSTDKMLVYTLLLFLRMLQQLQILLIMAIRLPTNNKP
jgi:hypothetical protein